VDLQVGARLAVPRPKRLDQLLLELEAADGELVASEAGFGRQDGTDLRQQPALESALRQLAQHCVQADEQRLGGRPLTQPLERDLAAHGKVVEEDRFLRREVAEDGAAADVRGAGDLVDRRLGVTLALEQVERGLGDAPARRRRAALARSSGGHGPGC
jgi:hypothetical protein